MALCMDSMECERGKWLPPDSLLEGLIMNSNFLLHILLIHGFIGMPSDASRLVVISSAVPVHF